MKLYYNEGKGSELNQYIVLFCTRFQVGYFMPFCSHNAHISTEGEEQYFELYIAKDNSG